MQKQDNKGMTIQIQHRRSQILKHSPGTWLRATELIRIVLINKSETEI